MRKKKPLIQQRHKIEKKEKKTLSTCGSLLTPPNKHTERILDDVLNWCTTACICWASSRVGASTNAMGPSPGFRGSWLWICTAAGSIYCGGKSVWTLNSIPELTKFHNYITKYTNSINTRLYTRNPAEAFKYMKLWTQKLSSLGNHAASMLFILKGELKNKIYKRKAKFLSFQLSWLIKLPKEL